jgi:hypothetical protein
MTNFVAEFLLIYIHIYVCVCVYCAQDRDSSQTLLNAVINLWFP